MGLNWDNLGWGLAQWGNTFNQWAEQKRQSELDEKRANTLGDIISMQNMQAERAQGDITGGLPSVEPPSTSEFYNPESDLNSRYNEILANIQNDPVLFQEFAPTLLQATNQVRGEIQARDQLMRDWNMLNTFMEKDPDFAEAFTPFYEQIDASDPASSADMIAMGNELAKDFMLMPYKKKLELKSKLSAETSEEGEELEELEKQRAFDAWLEKRKWELERQREDEEIDQKVSENKKDIGQLQTIGEKTASSLKTTVQDVDSTIDAWRQFQTDEDMQLALRTLVEEPFEIEGWGTGKGESPSFELSRSELIAGLTRLNTASGTGTNEWTANEVQDVINSIGEQKTGKKFVVKSDWLNRNVIPWLNDIAQDKMTLNGIARGIELQEKAKTQTAYAINRALRLSNHIDNSKQRLWNVISDESGEWSEEEKREAARIYREIQAIEEANRPFIDRFVVDRSTVDDEGNPVQRKAINPRFMKDFEGMNKADMMASVISVNGKDAIVNPEDISVSRMLGYETIYGAQKAEDKSRTEKATQKVRSAGRKIGESVGQMQEDFENMTGIDLPESYRETPEPKLNEKTKKFTEQLTAQQKKQGINIDPRSGIKAPPAPKEVKAVMPSISSIVGSATSDLQADIEEGLPVVFEYVDPKDGQWVRLGQNSREEFIGNFERYIEAELMDVHGVETNVNLYSPEFDEVREEIVNWWNKNYGDK